MAEIDGSWCSPEVFKEAHKERFQGSDLSRMQPGMDGFYNVMVAYRKSARILPVTINFVKPKTTQTHEVNFKLHAPDSDEEFFMQAKVKDGVIGRWSSTFSPLSKFGRLPSAAFFADAHWSGPDSSSITNYDTDALTEWAEQREDEAFQVAMTYVPFMGAYTHIFNNTQAANS